jgi:peptidoglycan/LPS O-acetylase OafA/YrhL
MTFSATSTPRDPGLDLLRALAILVVMLYHMSSHGFALPAIVERGWMGVDLFFVLSGYLIGWQLLRQTLRGSRPDWGAFMLGRTLRVLPAYLAVLALYAWVPAFREAEHMRPVGYFLSFTVNLFPDYQHSRAYSHAWSLCVEEHFYLLLPLALWLLGRGRGRGIVRVLLCAAVLVAGGMLLRGWLWRIDVAPHLLPGGDGRLGVIRYIEAIYNPTWTRLDGLLAGVLLAALRTFRPAWWARALAHGRVFLALGAAGVAAAIHGEPFSLPGSIVQFPLIACSFACLLLAALSPATGLDRIAVPGSRQLAVLAFSLYLTHRQVYAWLDAGLPDFAETAPAGAFLVYNAAALLAAAALYAAVERPGLMLRTWLLARRRAQRAPGSPDAPADALPQQASRLS